MLKNFDATSLRRSLVVISDYFPIIMPYGMRRLRINIEQPSWINNINNNNNVQDWDEEKPRKIGRKVEPIPLSHRIRQQLSLRIQLTNILPTTFQPVLASFKNLFSFQIFLTSLNHDCRKWTREQHCGTR